MARPLWRASAFQRDCWSGDSIAVAITLQHRSASLQATFGRPCNSCAVAALASTAALVSGVPAVLRCCCRVLIIGAAFDSGNLGQRSIGWPIFREKLPPAGAIPGAIIPVPVGYFSRLWSEEKESGPEGPPQIVSGAACSRSRGPNSHRDQ